MKAALALLQPLWRKRRKGGAVALGTVQAICDIGKTVAAMLEALASSADRAMSSRAVRERRQGAHGEPDRPLGAVDRHDAGVKSTIEAWGGGLGIG
jgi:hypothetical protein